MTYPPVYPGPYWGDPPQPPPRRRGVRAVAIIVPIVLTLGFIGAVSFAAFQVVRNLSAAAQPAAVDWQPYVDAGKTTVQYLTTVDYRTADRDVQRILDSSTGVFQDDFQKRSNEFMETVRKSQSASTGTITGAGLESLGNDQAQVLIAVNVTTDHAGRAEPDPRAWRLRITVDKLGDGYKASRVEFMP